MGSGRWVVVGGWWLVNGGKSLGGILEGGVWVVGVVRFLFLK